MVIKKRLPREKRKRGYFGRKAKKTQPLQKDLVKQKVLDRTSKKDLSIAESILLMLDEIERDSKYNDQYSLGYREGLKKAVRIIRKLYAT